MSAKIILYNLILTFETKPYLINGLYFYNKHKTGKKIKEWIIEYTQFKKLTLQLILMSLEIIVSPRIPTVLF